MRELCPREPIAQDPVVLHADNGGPRALALGHLVGHPVKGATLLATLQALGVMPSFSRPAVSNDHPFSASLFRTLKYRPAYPSQSFASLSIARQWIADFVHWDVSVQRLHLEFHNLFRHTVFS